MRLQPKNWQEFQHYKDRNPPWIKLHKKLLDDYEYHCLPTASKALAPLLWLLASEYQDGIIDASPKKLSFRLHIPEDEINEALEPLISAGFFVIYHNDSSVLAERKQPDSTLLSLARSRETETEAYKPEREKKETPPPTPKLALADFRTLYREKIGVEIGGGLNQEIVTICSDYTAEVIRDAILAAATRVPKPTNPFSYIRKVLRGEYVNDHPPPSKKSSPLDVKTSDDPAYWAQGVTA